MATSNKSSATRYQHKSSIASNLFLKPDPELLRFVEYDTFSHTLARPPGNMVRMKCPAIGNPKPTITWTINSDQTIDRDLGSVKSHHYSIVMDDLLPSDSGNYTCTVCNVHGCINHTIQLEVKAIAPGVPQFVQYSTFHRLLVRPSGNMVRMKCPATGNPIPTIAWTKDNGRTINRQMGGVKIRQYSIVLEDLMLSDSGNYTCKVCNLHGCINYTMQLQVNDRFPSKPIIKEGFPKNLTVERNSTTRIECPVLLADLAAHVEWVKYHAVNYSDILDFKNISYLENDLDNPEVYELSNITFADEGWYTCIASNSMGATFGSAYLRVVEKLPDDEVQPDGNSTVTRTVFVVALLGSFLLILSIIVFILLRRIKHERQNTERTMELVHQWTKKVIIEIPPLECGPSATARTIQIPIVRIEKQCIAYSELTNSRQFNEYEFPLDLNWEWSRTQLTLDQTLGEGAFGRVVLAQYQTESANKTGDSADEILVAVKMLREGHTDTDVASLVCEMEVMKMIGHHVNVLRILGCCCQNGPLYVIVEYAPLGNLKDFLIKNQRDVLQTTLVSIACQVARGMEYLTSRGCIHRDLAARNVLVCPDNVVKIADFGLARNVQSSEYYRMCRNGLLPIMWMAPESLRDRFFDSQSDVWSFGVLLWEIMACGAQPYPQVIEVEHLFGYLHAGNRMEKPSKCSVKMYNMMCMCWMWDAHDRPKFADIVIKLDQILGVGLMDDASDVYSNI